MNMISEIESAVSELSREELAVFRDWFNEFDAEAWDKQFEADVAAGRLDALAEGASRDVSLGQGDYIKDRGQWLDGLTLDDIVADIKARREV